MPTDGRQCQAASPRWGGLLAQVEATLARADIQSAAAEATVLACHVAQVAPGRLPLIRNDTPTLQQAARLRQLAAERAAGCPLQYVTGETYFLGLRLRCAPCALIPRQETEELAAHVIELAQRRPDVAALVADIGTGTGALAVALASNLPAARIVATDRSAQALMLARENARVHGIDARVRFLEGPYAEPLVRVGLAPDVTAVVCNPPYVAAAEWERLPCEIRDYEPREALVGPDEDGAGFYRQLLPELAAHLGALRLVAFEVGWGQAATVAELIHRWLPKMRVTVRRDLAGIERIVVGRAFLPDRAAGECE